jgi:hypothetical protein
VDGVWRMGADTFVVQMRRLEFDDLSRFVAGYEYALVRRKDQWTIETERESPCNKSDGQAVQEGTDP